VVTLFIGLIKLVTTGNNNISWIHTVYISLQHALSLLLLLCILQCPPVTASKGRRSTSSGFSNCPVPQQFSPNSILYYFSYRQLKKLVSSQTKFECNHTQLLSSWPAVSRPVRLAVRHIWGHWGDFSCCQTVAGLIMWGALKSKLTLHYDRRFVGTRLWPATDFSSFLIKFRQCGFVDVGWPLLTRGWVCSLHVVLGLASEVFLGFESRGTLPYYTVSNLGLSNLKRQVVLFISLRNRVAQL
jgi:hypothetical protein